MVGVAGDLCRLWRLYGSRRLAVVIRDTLMNVVNIVSDGPSEFNSGNYRGIIPQRAFLKAGHRYSIVHVREWMEQSERIKRLCAGADLIIVQRVAINESLKGAEFWRRLGKAVVIDQDDFYPGIEPHNQAYRFWAEGQVEVTAAPGVSYWKTIEPHPLKQLQQFVALTGTTTPGRLLMEYWKKYGPAYWVPNYFDTPRWLEARHYPRDENRVVIGYASSMSHVSSFEESGVKEALCEVLRQRPGVTFMLFGDKRLYNMIAGQKVYQPYVMWNQYQDFVTKFDIMIAPLAKKYDHYRSWIKLAEATLLGIPIVATRSIIYREFEEAGIGKYVSNGDFDGVPRTDRIQEWVTGLLDVVDNLTEYRRTASWWSEWGYNFLDIDVNLPKVIRTYEKICHDQS